MSLPPKHVAQRLLSRPAIGSMMVSEWLENELPKATQFLQNKYQMESREVRDQLAEEYNLPELRQPLGTGEFAAAYAQLQENVERLQDHEDDIAVRYKIEALHSHFKHFNEIGDMQILIANDALPELHTIANGSRTEINPTLLVEMFNTFGALFKRLDEEAPLGLQPDKPKALYAAFTDDMKQLISYAHKTTGQKMTHQALSPQPTHVEAAHATNRLEGYWRQH